MSIVLNGYVAVKDVNPGAPSWFRQERYDYCEQFDAHANSSKRTIFGRRTGKKNHK